MRFKAIIFGATGMVGEGVLHESLLHADVLSVLVVGRRPCQVSHPKLKEVILSDMMDLLPIEQQLKGYDACFFCLGVSSIGKNDSEYTRLTYDLTMGAARILAKLNPGMTFCYVSGTGTDSTEKGRSMWARVKGRTENDLMKLPFKSVFAFRPGFIKPTKGLKNAFAVAKVMGLFYPILRMLFAGYVCTLRDLGLAMIQVTKTGYSSNIIENVDIAKLARQNSPKE